MYNLVSGNLQTPDNHLIHYDLYRAGHRRLVIIAPGFFNNKMSILLKQLAQDLQSQYDVIIMDFRGHGKSSGLFYWTSKEYMDLTCVLRFFRPRYDKVAVIGFSLGAATSILTAAREEGIDSLIVVSPPTALEKIEYHFWQLDFENDIIFNWFYGKGNGVRPGPFWLAKTKPVSIIDQLKMPILFIHGTNDWLIKPWHSEVLHAKANSKKKIVIIQNGPHAEYLIRKKKDVILDTIKEWLGETL